MNVYEQYDRQVQPDRQFQNGKLRWVNTRADKETRYTHLEARKHTTVEQKERWAIDIIKVALKRSKKPVVSCSFGVDSIVTVYLTRKALEELGRDPSDIDIVWNDTKNEFQDVRKFQKWITDEWNLRLIITAPKKVLKKVIDDNGGIDSSYFTARKSDRRQGQPLSEKCCGTLKHEPMKRATKENQWDLIINGLRADESSQRMMAAARDGEFFYSSGEWKAYVCRPILFMDDNDVWEYVEKNDIPYNNIYNQNIVQSYPKDMNKLTDDLIQQLEEVGITKDMIDNQEIYEVGRKQAKLLQKAGFKMFTPRTGCQMCPIPVKYGYMQWMRTYYPKVYDAMVFNLGYGKALLEMVGEETRLEIEMLTGVDITAENAHEHLQEIIEGKPCIFDEFD